MAFSGGVLLTTGVAYFRILQKSTGCCSLAEPFDGCTLIVFVPVGLLVRGRWGFFDSMIALVQQILVEVSRICNSHLRTSKNEQDDMDDIVISQNQYLVGYTY